MSPLPLDLPAPSCDNCWHKESTNPKCGLCTGPDTGYSKWWPISANPNAQPKEKS